MKIMSHLQTDSSLVAQLYRLLAEKYLSKNVNIGTNFSRLDPFLIQSATCICCKF